jgi:hypothetical protein
MMASLAETCCEIKQIEGTSKPSGLLLSYTRTDKSRNIEVYVQCNRKLQNV